MIALMSFDPPRTQPIAGPLGHQGHGALHADMLVDMSVLRQSDFKLCRTPKDPGFPVESAKLRVAFPKTRWRHSRLWLCSHRRAYPE